MCANFQGKHTTLTFLAQIRPRGNLELEIQKTNVGIRISILEIPCVPIFRKNKQLWLFELKFSQKWIFGVWIRNQHLQHTLRANFQSKWITLIFWPKFGGNCLATCDILIGILLRVLQRAGWRLNELSGDEWSWVEVEMSWVEVDGAGWRWVHGLVIRTFKTPWGKLPNLLEMKLTADVTWLFLSSVNTDIFVYFFCYRCGLWK